MGRLDLAPRMCRCAAGKEFPREIDYCSLTERSQAQRMPNVQTTHQRAKATANGAACEPRAGWMVWLES